MVIVEICTENFEDSKNAIAAGADRIELCADLENDGLTPSVELLAQVLELARKHQVTVFPMVRCRAGNFVYNDAEKQTMIEHAVAFLGMGVTGVVVGALTADMRPDIEFLAEFARVLQSINPKIQITFHKAIDYVRLTQGETLADVVAMLEPYCARVLTSGGCGTAMEGSMEIRKISERNRAPVPIAAGKIRADNAAELLELTGATEIHSRSVHVCSALGKPSRVVL